MVLEIVVNVEELKLQSTGSTRVPIGVGNEKKKKKKRGTSVKDAKEKRERNVGSDKPR
jgi:hypothetical protein